MSDALLLETGDNLLLETGDNALLEELGTVGAGTQEITFTAPVVGLGVPAGTQAFTFTAPAASGAIPAGTLALVFTAPTVTAAGLFTYRETLEIAAALSGSEFRFRDQVALVQIPLDTFRDTVAIAAALASFRDRLRIIPDVATLFADDIQRPVGRLEME
jgi:hypothetical protein